MTAPAESEAGGGKRPAGGADEDRTMSRHLQATYERIVDRLVEEIAADTAVEIICSFGGAATGKVQPGSDIDLVVFTRRHSYVDKQTRVVDGVHVSTWFGSTQTLLADFAAAGDVTGTADPQRLLNDLKPIFDPQGIYARELRELRDKVESGGRLKPEKQRRVINGYIEAADRCLRQAERAAADGQDRIATQWSRIAMHGLSEALHVFNRTPCGGSRSYLPTLAALPQLPGGFYESFLAVYACDPDGPPGAPLADQALELFTGIMSMLELEPTDLLEWDALGSGHD